MGEMAKKIIKLDLDELLKVLNEAYAEEWQRNLKNTPERS